MKTPQGQIPFKIYYQDGSTYVGPVAEAPILDVVLILEFDGNHGRHIVSGGDFYMWDKFAERWLHGDEWSMMAYMARPYMEKRFLCGVMCDQDTWNRTLSQAEHDADFPKRVARYVWEDLTTR